MSVHVLEINKKEYGYLGDVAIKETLGLLPIWVLNWQLQPEGKTLFEYLRDTYGHGLYKFNGTIEEGDVYRSPSEEDEDLQYIAKMKTREGEIIFYPYAITAIPTKDGHYITRMD